MKPYLIPYLMFLNYFTICLSKFNSLLHTEKKKKSSKKSTASSLSIQDCSTSHQPKTSQDICSRIAWPSTNFTRNIFLFLLPCLLIVLDQVTLRSWWFQRPPWVSETPVSPEMHALQHVEEFSDSHETWQQREKLNGGTPRTRHGNPNDLKLIPKGKMCMCECESGESGAKRMYLLKSWSFLIYSDSHILLNYDMLETLKNIVNGSSPCS